jgi:2-polyprenyl-6-methoxyphenol hydroxylase-like FAD-dependent oxidoreductase
MLHPRTLELLRPLGLTSELLRHGRPLREVTVHVGRRAMRLRLPELAPDTPYPYLFMLPQARFEAALQRHLLDRGVAIEWGVRLRGYSEVGRVVVAGIDRGPDIRAQFLVGCDGPDSTVRKAAGIGFPGGTYRSPVTLADMRITGLPSAGLHVLAGRRGITFVGAVGEHAPWRMLTTVPRAQGDGDLSRLLAQAGIKADRPAWSQAYPQRYGLASRYRAGRVFIAGDAAHVHSPAGGQGTNAGVGDACNLGWKLALALQGMAGDPLLDTYQEERRALARLLVGLTSLIYIGESSSNPLVSVMRRYGPELALPFVAAVAPAVRLMLRTMGQLTHSYGYGPAARDATPRLRHGPGPGQRLRDAMVTIDGQRRSVQEVTATPGMHLLLAGWPHDETHVSDLGWIQSHRLETLLDGSPGCGYYLVRPDGYIGLRGAGCDLGPVERFLREWR